MSFIFIFIALGIFPYHAECVVNSTNILPSSSISPIYTTSIIISSTAYTTPVSSAVLPNITTQAAGNMTTQMAPVTTTTSTNDSTTDSPTTPAGTQCVGYTSWSQDVYMNSLNCKTDKCIKSFVPIYNQYFTCNNHVKKDETQNIAAQLSEVLLKRAIQITEEGKKDPFSRMYGKTVERVSAKHFAAEFGTLKKNLYLSFKTVTVDFHEYGIPDILVFPPTILEEEEVSFQCSIYVNIYKTDENYEYWRELTPLRKALSKLPPSLTNPAPQNDIGYQINSNILSFNLSPPKKVFFEYILIKFYYRDPKGTTNHRCVRFTTYWTDAGCYEHQKEDTFVLCRCETVSGRYAIISDLAIPPVTPTKLERTSKTTALLAISGFGIFAAFASILLPYILKCQHLKGMLRIYKAADLTFIVFCGFVLLSVLRSDDLGTAKLFASILHFLHQASAVWYIVEGVHLFHEMTPLYSDSIGMIFCYSTVAFGISAALAGASTGFEYAFSGKTEFLWAYASGGGMMYMLVPTLGIIIMQIVFSVLLVRELMSWIGSQYDYLYTRSTIFIRRCTGYVFVYAITQVLGVVAMMNQGNNTYDWMFIGFYGIETLCLFYHHCVGNMECWSWKEIQDFKKELERNEELKKALGLDDSDDSDSSDDEASDEEGKEAIAKTDRSAKGDLVINMEDGSVFYGNPTKTPSSHTSSRQTRRKSEYSTSSKLKLLREDSFSLSSASDKSLRKTPRLYPRLDEDIMHGQYESQVSIATTVSHKSLHDGSKTVQNENENLNTQDEYMDENLENENQERKSEIKGSQGDQSTEVQSENSESQNENIEAQDENIETPDENIETQDENKETQEKNPDSQDENQETQDENMETKDESTESQNENIETQDETSESHNENTETQEKNPDSQDENQETEDENMETKDESAESQNENIETQDENPESQDVNPETQDQAPEAHDENPETQIETPESHDENPETQDEAPESHDENTGNNDDTASNQDENSENQPNGETI